MIKLKEATEQVWPVENYTDKIQVGVKAQMRRFAHLAFTVDQLLPYVQSGYPWLKNPNERQMTWLKAIIGKTLGKLVQQGLVKKVKSNVQVAPQWQWAEAVKNSGYQDVTSQDDVATTDAAKKAVGRRSIGGRALWRLNQPVKLGQYHA